MGKLPSVRTANLLLFIGCTIMIVAALYMQYAMSMQPCALCITQRVFVILVGLIALLATLHNPKRIGQRIYAALAIIAAIAGGYFSQHQLYLQSLPPDQAPACGPGLQYMLEAFPLRDALDLLLHGDGNCAEVHWRLLGLTIPAWTLIAFSGLGLINVWQFLRRPKS